MTPGPKGQIHPSRHSGSNDHQRTTRVQQEDNTRLAIVISTQPFIQHVCASTDALISAHAQANFPTTSGCSTEFPLVQLHNPMHQLPFPNCCCSLQPTLHRGSCYLKVAPNQGSSRQLCTQTRTLASTKTNCTKRPGGGDAAQKSCAPNLDAEYVTATLLGQVRYQPYMAVI